MKPQKQNRIVEKFKEIISNYKLDEKEIIDDINTEITLYFKNGYLIRITPENTEDFYDCRYIVSDGISYDLLDIQSIKSIPVPDFQIINSLEGYGATGSLDYVIRMKAGRYFNSNEKELCSACLWKSTELMFANKYFIWKKVDFERLIDWHQKLNMPLEVEKAILYLEDKFSNNIFDSTALSIKESTFRNLKHSKMDLVVFHGYKGGCCSECSKMIGRVYSVSGKNKTFPKLPEYVKVHGNFHNGCRCTMSPYFEENEIFHHGEHVNAIKSSIRPWVDDRTEHEINAYQSYLNRIEEEKKKENDRKEYGEILIILPDFAPKSFGAYRKMKNSNSKNFEKLKKLAFEKGLEIK